MTRMGDCDIRLMAEGRIICWDQMADLENRSVTQVLANIRGGMKKKKSKKRKTNPWVSDEGSGERSSSAEEQFKELDKQELMENHKREMGNEHIDMLANMNTEQAEEMLMNFREKMSGVTEDQKTIAMMSLMWMVERRKEEQREPQSEKRVSQSEKRTEGEGTKKWLNGNRRNRRGKIQTTLEKLADKKREDRRRLEREGDEIMELSRKDERKQAEEKRENKSDEIWAKWEDRQRLERQGDEIMEIGGMSKMKKKRGGRRKG